MASSTVPAVAMRSQSSTDAATLRRPNMMSAVEDDPSPYLTPTQRRPAFIEMLTSRSVPLARRGPVTDVEKGESGVAQFSPPTVDDRTTQRKYKHDYAYDLAAMFVEFIGTFMFLFLAYTAAQSAEYNLDSSAGRDIGSVGAHLDNQTVLFIALSFGMSLVVTAWTFFRITGAAFNPAVTLSLWLVGNLSTLRATLIIAAQLLGGIAAAAVSKGLTLARFGVANALTPGLSDGKGLAIEMFTTAGLIFTVLMMAAEKHKGTFLAPVCIGLSLFIGHLASVGWTGAGMNPARTLGPQVVEASFPSYAWIYYVGQIFGALLATAVYVVVKHLDYQKIVENVDTENVNASQAISAAPLAQGFATLGMTFGSEAGDTEVSKRASTMFGDERRTTGGEIKSVRSTTSAELEPVKSSSARSAHVSRSRAASSAV